MSACLCTHSYHDEIFNFTGVEWTNTEINVHLFDNAIDYRIKNKLEKYLMTDRWRRITPNIKGSFTVSVMYKTYSKT